MHQISEDFGVSWPARGDHARAAYLSLNRGDGGQNVIGPSSEPWRHPTEELLQARASTALTSSSRGVRLRLSKSRTRTAAREYERGSSATWSASSALSPAGGSLRWTGTSADGHGHHQLVGDLTPPAVGGGRSVGVPRAAGADRCCGSRRGCTGRCFRKSRATTRAGAHQYLRPRAGPHVRGDRR